LVVRSQKLCYQTMSSMAAVACFEGWENDNVQVLVKILDEPSREHDVHKMLSRDGVRVAHVVAIVGQLSTKPGGPWNKCYKGRLRGGQAVALHTWLYHMGGGAEAKLLPPTGVQNDSLAIVQTIEREVASHKTRRRELMAKLTKAASAGNCTQGVQRELAEHYSVALQPFEWAPLRTREAAPTQSGGGGGGGAGATRAEHSTAKRDLRVLVACMATRPLSPFYALGGHDDILFMICEMACIGGMAHWAPLRYAPSPPRPPPALSCTRLRVVAFARYTDCGSA
jgi:hypothetical protein